MSSDSERPVFSDSYAARVALQVDAIERRLAEMDTSIRNVIALVEQNNQQARSYALQVARSETQKAAVDWKTLNKLEVDIPVMKEQLSNLTKAASVGLKRLDELTEQINDSSGAAESLSDRFHELEKKPAPPSRVWWIAWGAAAAILLFAGLNR